MPARLDAVHSPRCLGPRRTDCLSLLAGLRGSLASRVQALPGKPGFRDDGGEWGAAGGAAPGWGGRRARLKDREWEEVWV